jgi:NADH dehydrogenase FAD-containing subunit
MKILILGGGYAGLMAALRLANQGLGENVTLVNAGPTLVERVRNHELAASKVPPRRPISHMLRRTGVRFVVGWVTAIDLDRRVVRLAGGGELDFDRLLVALGSVADDRGVPGVKQHALAIGEEMGALGLRAALDSGAREIVVVGGGLTGIETAAELAERGARVTLVTPTAVAGFLSLSGQAYVQDALARMGVRVVSGKVDEVRPEGVVLDHEVLRCDACVWAAGFRAPPLARDAGLSVDDAGRILVDAQLRSLSHPQIYAVGDAADPRFDAGAPLRSGCKYAMPMGVHAADNLARSTRGEEERPFRLGDSVFCVSLGRRDGVIQSMSRNGEPRRIYTGALAAWIKERVVRYTVFSMQVERCFTFYHWPQLGRASGELARKQLSA